MNNDKKVLKVPPLRFPEFHGEWQTSKVGDLVTEVDYGMNASAKEFDGKNIYIRITDIDEASRRVNFNKITSPNTHLEEKYMLKLYDILIARTGASTGKSYIFDSDISNVYFAGFLIRFRMSKDVNPYFFYHVTNSQKFKTWVGVTSARSGQPGINSYEYKSFEFMLPKIEEQNKLVSLLNKIDEKIETQSKIIEHYKTLIKGLSHQILEKNILGNKKTQMKLSDVLVCEKKEPVDPNEYSKITIRLHKKGLAFSETSRTKVDARPFYLRSEGQIIIGKQNYFNGSIAIVTKEFHNSVCSNAIMSFNVKNSFDKEYIYFTLSNDNYIRKYASLANGTGQKELSEKDFLNFNILIPEIDEQIKISTILKKMEQSLKLEKDLLQMFNTKKFYFLSELFL